MAKCKKRGCSAEAISGTTRCKNHTISGGTVYERREFKIANGAPNKGKSSKNVNDKNNKRGDSNKKD